MSSVPPEKRCTTFLRFATSETASATPDDHGPTIKRAPSPSTASSARRVDVPACTSTRRAEEDRKSTRLNSSHVKISYAVFCLKKKKMNQKYGAMDAHVWS